MKPEKKSFPCPACGDERDAVDQACRTCGWGHDRPETNSRDDTVNLLPVRACLRCGSGNLSWGTLMGARYVDDDTPVFGTSLAVRCCRCLVCNNLDLTADPLF